MSDLAAVLAAFHDATGCDTALWVAGGDGTARLEAAAPATAGEPPPTPAGGEPARVRLAGGPALVAEVPGPRRAWLRVGPCPDPRAHLEQYLRFLLPVVSQYLQSSLEVEHAANELAERYEEINLLYTITEILGRSVSLEETAATILKEVSETVGARRGSILVRDRVTDTLQAVAALGAPVRAIPPIATDDPASVSARAFREQRAIITEDGASAYDAEAPYRSGTMLSVPIMWTSPAGAAEILGVVNLSGRATPQPFTAGDQKLIAAIATQIGTAIQNARLVRASLNQQRLVREMELAHDLQMRLLPRTEVVAPEARVAARVVPAESVGGDFYNLFRLGEARTGVMVADVSSHGYRAALIMALAMSAAAIHAQASSEPGQMLAALLASLREELVTTEMYISAFYAVIDRRAGTLRYSNTGHPHAFVIDPSGEAERLSATDPPLGLVDDPPHDVTRRWRAGEDLLVLFTDGINDARDRFGARFGEQRVLDAARRHLGEPPHVVLDAIFRDLADFTGDAVQRDDLTCVVLRS